MPSLIEQANAYLEQRHYEAAIALYQQVIDAQPHDLSAYWALGLAWLLSGDSEEAQGVWMLALSEVDVSDDDLAAFQDLLNTTAQRLLDAQDFQRAEQVYSQLIELNSLSVVPYLQLGSAIAQQGRYDEAIALWQQAIELEPTCSVAYSHLAITWEKLGNLPEAIAMYQELCSIQSQLGKDIYRLGLCHVRSGNVRQAVFCFEQVLQLYPKWAKGWGDGGMVYLLKGDLEKAIAAWQTMVTHGSTFCQTYDHWVREENAGALNADLIPNAVWLRSLLAGMRDPEGWKALGQLLSRAGRISEAIAMYQVAIERACTTGQADTSLYVELGQQLQKTGQFDRAIAILKQGLEESTPTAALYFELAKVAGKQGAIDEAIRFVHQALEQDDPPPDCYILLGNLYGAKGLLNEAIATYSQLKNLDGFHGFVDYYLGMAALQQGQIDQAISSFKTCLIDHPEVIRLIAPLLQSSSSSPQLTPQKLRVELPPVQGYATTQAWIEQQEEKGDRLTPELIPILPTEWIELVPPKSIEDEIHFSFRFGNVIEIPPCFVTRIEQGRFWLSPDQGATAILTENHEVLGDLSPYFPILSPGHPDMDVQNHPIFQQPYLVPMTYVDARVCVLSGVLNDIYFHWMLDVLPRFELLKNSGFSVDKVDYFVVNTRCRFQRETLEKLGIPSAKMMNAQDHLHLQARELVIPSFPGAIAWYQSWIVPFFKQLYGHPPMQSIPSPRRIYISRAKTSNRRVINESAIITLLEQYGFQSVTLEGLSIPEQATLFAHAEVIIAPHGSGLTNLVFCQAGTTVIELFAANYVYPCYWYLSNLVILNYFYVVGSMPEGALVHQLLYPHERIEDMFISLEVLRETLHRANLG
jgi:tetratricopeptide (TPR) repeat protein